MGEHREENRRQDGDDCDNNKQFNERKRSSDSAIQNNLPNGDKFYPHIADCIIVSDSVLNSKSILEDFLSAEFGQPWSLHEIAAAVSSPVVAAQVFTVSLLAVDVDTPAEREYLISLRQTLGLDEGQARSIARRLGREGFELYRQP